MKNLKAPLLETLFNYHKEKNLILSMPGNKCGKAFLEDDLGKEFVNKMGYMDITEVDPLDNLHCPEGVIKEAQNLLANTYKSNKAYFLVNGSSSGNLASIFSAFNEGDEVIVERNCHKSIYNALILRKLNVTYIEAVIDYENDIFLMPNEKNIYEALSKCKNPKGIILTYPNYFGVTYDIEEILLDLKKRGLKVLLDSAHGAHFIASDKLPKALTSLANYVVISAHKTLPALTQGAYLLSNDENNDLLEFYIKAFMTTSPSYLIMASLDYSRYYLDNLAKDRYEYLIDIAEVWKEKINKLNKVRILSKCCLEKYSSNYDIDLTRYIMVLPANFNGHKFYEYLRNNQIQCEMSFSRGVVMILSPCNNEEDFNNIYNIIKKMDMNKFNDKKQNYYYSNIPEKVFEPYEVFNLDYEEIDIRLSEQRISIESLIPYPPGIPVVCAGEIITRESINIIVNYLKNNKEIIGIRGNKVKVSIDKSSKK